MYKSTKIFFKPDLYSAAVTKWALSVSCPTQSTLYNPLYTPPYFQSQKPAHKVRRSVHPSSKLVETHGCPR